MKITRRQIGLGMIQQMQHVCPDCRGSGNGNFIFHILFGCFMMFPPAHLSLMQVRSLTREINVLSAKETKFPRKRRCWKCMLRRVCSRVRRLFLKDKLMKL